MRVCIDAGHGGRDPGAIGTRGTREAALNLRVAEKVASLFSSYGQKPMMTRTNNTCLTLERRAGVANEHQVDVFVSIHCNSAENPKATGFEVWTTRGDTAADGLAEQVYCAITERVSEMRGRPDRSDGDSDREADFYVLRKTKAPAVLVELGFLSNPVDEALLLSDDLQARMAEGIVLGTCRWMAKRRLSQKAAGEATGPDGVKRRSEDAATVLNEFERGSGDSGGGQEQRNGTHGTDGANGTGPDPRPLTPDPCHGSGHGA